MELLMIRVRLDERGWDKRVETWEVKDTGKCYSNVGNRISKDKLMKPDSIFFESHKWFHYFTYCLPEQVENAKDMLTNHILAKFKQVKLTVDAISIYVPNNEPNLEVSDTTEEPQRTES